MNRSTTSLSRTGSMNRSTTCSSCQNDTNSDSFVTAHPCSHRFCSECFITLLAHRKSDKYVTCCGCQSEITAHVYTSARARSTEENEEKQQQKVDHQPPKIDLRQHPNELKDPLRCFLKEFPHDDLEGRGFIYVATVVKGEDSIRTRKASFTDEKGFDSADDEAQLVDIFRILHRPLINSHPEFKGKGKAVPTLNAMALAQYALTDDQVLLKCMYGLSTGLLLDDAERQELAVRGDPRRVWLMSAYGACDLIIRATKQIPGRLQLAIGNSTMAFTKSKTLLQLLQSLGLSVGYDTLNKKKKGKGAAVYAHQVVIPHRALVIMTLDNLGFIDKLHGTYVQTTTMATQVVLEEQMKAYGLYHDDPNKRISRVRKTLDELCVEQETPALEIIQLTQHDYETLTFYVMRHLEYCLSLELPSLEYCRHMVRTKQFATGIYVQKNLGVDVSRRPEHVRSESGHRAFLSPRKSDGTRRERVEGPRVFDSILDANNITLDIPIHDNLAKREVLKECIEYCLRTQERANRADDEIRQEGEEPTVMKMFAPWGGDGQPISAAHKLKDEDAADEANENKYDGLLPGPGGFHMMSELINMSAALLSDIKRYYISKDRATKGQQDYVLYPSDPRQYEENQIQYTLGFNAGMIDSYAESFALRKEEVSPEEVHANILSKAHEGSCAMSLLIEHRITTVYYMFRDAEKSNSSDLFFTAVRAALPLFCVTNAHHYVRICTEFLKFWKLASPAERIIYDEFLFTAKTADGKTIFVDRMHEIVNMMYRSVTGRIAYPGLKDDMIMATSELPAIIATKKAVERSRGGHGTRPKEDFNERRTQLGEIYVKTYLAVRDGNVWGHGTTFVEKPDGRGGDYTPIDNPDMLYTPSGQELSAQVLQAWSIGEERAEAYVEQYLLVDQNVAVRPFSGHDAIPLNNISTKAEDIPAKKAKSITLQTAVDVDEIKIASNKRKDPIVVELRKLFEAFPEAPEAGDCRDKRALGGKTVAQLAEILASYRERYYATIEGAQETDFNRANLSGASLSAEERRDELWNPFYQLEASVLRKFMTTQSITRSN